MNLSDPFGRVAGIPPAEAPKPAPIKREKTGRREQVRRHFDLGPSTTAQLARDLGVKPMVASCALSSYRHMLNIYILEWSKLGPIYAMSKTGPKDDAPRPTFSGITAQDVAELARQAGVDVGGDDRLARAFLHVAKMAEQRAVKLARKTP